ncbi:MAG: pilus assembly protein N-terminal domain-containing protein [Planctomycetota bacterium]|nr:pilus assembly protein N-terminal domain-containing protein [Planctomycetota bacterium]
MKSNQMTGRAWVRRVLRQATLFGGIASAVCIHAGLTSAQDTLRPMPPKAWKSAGPWRAIGISPRKPAQAVSLASAQESPNPSASPQAGGVVNAIATDQAKEPSLVKVPSIKIHQPEASSITSNLPTVPNLPSLPNVSLPTELETSRSIGAKVRLSASSISQVPSQGVALESPSTNAANLKVTRSGDITAETPVKVNFNQERILALPALPSASSPFAETGIEIPVRVEAVAETVQTILESQPQMVELPAMGIVPVTPLDIPTLDLPPELQAPELEAPKLEAPELEVPELEVPELEVPETEAPKFEAPKLDEMNRSDESAASNAVQTLNPEVDVLTLANPALSAKRAIGPVSAASSIVPLPRIDATSEEIEAISKLARSTKPSSDKAMMDGVLSQPGDEVLITSGPLSKLIDSEAAESVILESQAIRAVQVPGPISRLHVVDSSVCQVVCNGNRLFIVADQPGQTIIEANMGKLQKPLHMKVVVERPWARGKSASVNLDQMQAIVSHLAPTAEITVQPSDEGSLIVTGFAQSNQQAKKVLEAIRKMVLVPVVDQVEVR